MSNLKSFILGIGFTFIALLATYGAFALAQTTGKSVPDIALLVAKTAEINSPLSVVGEGGNLVDIGLYINKIEMDDVICYYATEQFLTNDIDSLNKIKALGCVKVE